MDCLQVNVEAGLVPMNVLYEWIATLGKRKRLQRAWQLVQLLAHFCHKYGRRSSLFNTKSLNMVFVTGFSN
jgi:hypothetical protein